MSSQSPLDNGLSALVSIPGTMQAIYINSMIKPYKANPCLVQAVDKTKKVGQIMMKIMHCTSNGYDHASY